MALFMMLLRKMIKNRWLVSSLMLGLLLTTALASSMPIYKNAILQRMLMKDLEHYYVHSGTYPGSLTGSAAFSLNDRDAGRSELLQQLDRNWQERVIDDESFSTLEFIQERKTVKLNMIPVDSSKANPDTKRSISLMMRSALTERVMLVDGRLPSAEPVNGAYEALVTDKVLREMDMVLGVEFISDDAKLPSPVRVIPVGVMEESELQELYWNRRTLNSYNSNELFVHEELFANEIMRQARVPILEAHWNLMLDYRAFGLDTVQQLLAVKKEMADVYKQFSNIRGSIALPAESQFVAFEDREQRLKSILWSLNVPLFLLIAFFLYMVSTLLIQRGQQEIALLRSRGARRLQVVLLFSMESAILAVIALLAGPWIGAWFTKLLGSSNTFMTFVQRTALDVKVDAEVYAYAGIAVLFALIINIMPVLIAARHSIVDQKRSSARQQQKSWWHLLGLDFILLGLAFYGYYSFQRRIQDLLALGLDSQEVSVDPLLFAVPSFFILGFGLLLLRLYPLVIRLIYHLGKSRWSPALYSSLQQVGRRSNQYHALMLFMILTLGTGIFNASAARTLNENMEDQIWYRQGGDIVLQQRWVNDEPPSASDSEAMGQAAAAAASAQNINYLEPPFEVYNTLPGVATAAKVFTQENGFMWTKDDFNNSVKIMGIDTDAFGEAAWMKNGLLPHHFYDYLNLIAPDPHAVLISRTLADHYGIEIGDALSISWEGRGQLPVTVYAIVEYFPSFNPNHTAAAASKELAPMLIVGHLAAIQNSIALEPYEVWLKLNSSADRQELFDALTEKEIAVTSIEDTYAMITDSRNDPFRMAVNGVMSLGFILSLFISFIGFLLYWVLSLQGKMLQLGVFRAMGISYMGMLGMLLMEQLLTSGAGIVIGLLAGAIASHTFVQMFQVSFDPGQIVPPFEVLIQASDTWQLLILTGIMLSVALLSLGVLLRRMKIHQAVKLGED